IKTVEEGDKAPVTTVTVKEEEIPEEQVEETSERPDEIEELPEEVKVVETVTPDKVTRKVVKKKIFKKPKEGGKVETTEITTVEEQGKEPEQTVTVKTSKPKKVKVDEEKVESLKVPEEKPRKAKPIIQEMPEEVKVTEIISEEHEPVKRVEKKRVIRKRDGRKQEVTEIKTVEEGDKAPVTTVTVKEEEIPEEQVEEIPTKMLENPDEIEELPEEVKVVETVTPDKVTRKVIKKKI
ncbi:hypothetical protein Trydic_g3645, partial [Trypoxylus dichotomus]